jgi:hypothetical protein
VRASSPSDPRHPQRHSRGRTSVRRITSTTCSVGPGSYELPSLFSCRFDANRFFADSPTFTFSKTRRLNLDISTSPGVVVYTPDPSKREKAAPAYGLGSSPKRDVYWDRKLYNRSPGPVYSYILHKDLGSPQHLKQVVRGPSLFCLAFHAARTLRPTPSRSPPPLRQSQPVVEGARKESGLREGAQRCFTHPRYLPTTTRQVQAAAATIAIPGDSWSRGLQRL